MQYTTTYRSPVGGILLASDGTGLTGLWFEGEKFYADGLDPEYMEKRHPMEGEHSMEVEHSMGKNHFVEENHSMEKDIPVFETVKKWLNIYFSGREPDFMPPVHMAGTPFRLSIWKLLRQIPYGETVTYGKLAEMAAKERGIARMSAQAVGGAVGHNPISVIIPCHRVVGSDGSLTGYAGGLDIKAKLLSLEGADMKKFYVPTKGTAL